MSDDVSIARLFPEPEESLTDEGIAGCYAAEREPWLRVNFVESVDGAATRAGRSGGLGNAADRRVFGIMRRLCDVVLVGAGTIRAEGYGGMKVDSAAEAWRVEHGLSPQPRLAIVSDRLALTPDDPVFAEAVMRPLLVTNAASADGGAARFADVADVVVAGSDRVDAATIPQRLADRGLPRVTCEGGPALFGALAGAGAVDEVCVTVSPLLAGGRGPRIMRIADDLGQSLRLAHVLSSQGTLLLRYLTDL